MLYLHQFVGTTDESIYQTDYTARKAFANHLSSSIIWTIIEKFLRQLSNEIQRELLKNFSSVFKDELERSFQMLADSPFIPHLHEREYLQYVKLNKLFFDGYEVIIYPDRWINSASICDFCIKVLNCEYPPKEWEVLQAIVENCGCIFPFEKLVIVCDRPCIFSLDSRNRLHAEGKPAIAFADGYSLYAYHGVWLPEKYGKIHPIEWRSEWLLEEDNAELRRVLIQAIGYDRIILYLQTTELDTFQEYRLLKIDKNIDEEPIYLLKMNCPSTGNIHILRVPPDMRSAREAIAWVNWGIDPEEFSVQT